MTEGRHIENVPTIFKEPGKEKLRRFPRSCGTYVKWKPKYALKSQSMLSSRNERSVEGKPLHLGSSELHFPWNLSHSLSCVWFGVSEMGHVTFLADLTLWKMCFINTVTGWLQVPQWIWDWQKLISHQPVAILKWLRFILRFLFVCRNFYWTKLQGEIKKKTCKNFLIESDPGCICLRNPTLESVPTPYIWPFVCVSLSKIHSIIFNT